MSRSGKPEEAHGVRLDKWLWAARFFKTRSLAREAVDGGKVHVNGDRCKPGRVMNTGMLLRIRRGSEEIEVVVLGLSEQRGPAATAQTLYQETEASVTARARQAELRRLDRISGPQTEGRPDKRDRRRIQELLRKNQW